jgi:hypothetical protein
MPRKKSAKAGRPPRHEGERLSKNRTFRVRGDLDGRLQGAAREAGHSVSEEIERRLEESFRTEDLYGGPHISAVFRAMASHLALARAKAGEDWAKNDQVRDELAQAFANLLARELPAFAYVSINTIGPRGELRDVHSFANEEIRKRYSDAPEIMRQIHEAVASKQSNAKPEDLK